MKQSCQNNCFDEQIDVRASQSLIDNHLSLRSISVKNGDSTSEAMT